MIYYPVPLHAQEAYKGAGYDDAEFPVTNQLVKTVISLPIHTEMDDEQLTHICSSIKEYVETHLVNTTTD